MLEVWNAWMTLPLNVQLICLTPLLAIPLLWYCHPKRLGQGWSWEWQQRIDREIRETRKRTNRKNRKAAMTETFAKLMVDLKLETGGVNFIFMPNPEHRYVWMYLYRKIHYSL